MDLFKVITPEEAVAIMLKFIENASLPVEVIPVRSALDRVLADAIISPEDVPGFPRSTVDGFAVRACDTFGATEALPAFLRIIGEVLMGKAADVSLKPGEAVREPTGGMMPDGADAVVMVEHTEEMGDGFVNVMKGVAPGENTVSKGHDIGKGEVLMNRGQRLGPPALAGLAGMGITDVLVFKRPRVAVLSTGDEIVPEDEEPGPGQVRDMNSLGLGAMVVQDGAEALYLGLVKDKREALEERIKSTWDEWDMLLISGGSSVGARDVTACVISDLGRVLAHGLALKPGKPTILGVARNKAIFGLPGHPSSALVSYSAVVRPVLLAMAGEKDPKTRFPTVKARILRNVASPMGRVDMVRVALKKEGTEWAAVPVLGASALISPLIRADGYVKVPLGKNGLSYGEEVEVILGGP